MKDRAVIVGKNNAGKSSFVEALRLVSLITSRYEHSNFREAPSWLDEHPIAARGIQPSIEGLDISPEGIFHHYGNAPAKISARFQNNSSVDIYIGPEAEVFSVIRNPTGAAINHRKDARTAQLPVISILPPLGPLTKKEKKLDQDYVKRAIASTSAHLHLRNQIELWPDSAYDHFRAYAEEWPGIKIHEFRRDNHDSETRLSLMVRDESFVAEAAWMGYGLQMWLQIAWFLARSRHSASVILDEPDVHLHPDLQRRLIRVLKKLRSQVILTTHSIEILSEVRPEEVLIIDKRKRESNYATSVQAVQALLDRVGTAHNLQLSRLWNAKKVLLVEGKDVKLLKYFQEAMHEDIDEPIDSLPHMPLGGWGNWHLAFGSSMLLKNAADEGINTYCILDRDYHTEVEISERFEEAAKRDVRLHIWQRKEIENYFLAPPAIHRAILTKLRPKSTPPTLQEVESNIETLTETLKDNTAESIADEIQKGDKKMALQTALRKARAIVDSRWGTFEGRLTIVSGKDLRSAISAWSQASYGVSLSLHAIATELTPADVPNEVRSVLKTIENNTPFP